MGLNIRSVLVVAVPALIAVVGTIFWFRKKKPKNALENRKPPDKTSKLEEISTSLLPQNVPHENLPNGSVLDGNKRPRRIESYGDLEKQGGHACKKIKDDIVEDVAVVTTIVPVESAVTASHDTTIEECPSKCQGDGETQEVVSKIGSDQESPVDRRSDIDEGGDAKPIIVEEKQVEDVCRDCKFDQISGIPSPSNNNMYSKQNTSVEVTSTSNAIHPPSVSEKQSTPPVISIDQASLNVEGIESVGLIASDQSVLPTNWSTTVEDDAWGSDIPSQMQAEIVPVHPDALGTAEDCETWGTQSVDLLGGSLHVDTVANGEHNGLEGFSSTSTDSNVDAVSEDSGKGASLCDPQIQDPNEIVSYEFDFPSDLCGRLIGKNGRNVNQIKDQSGVEIVIKQKMFTPDYQIISLEGTHNAVEKGLRMIKNRFPPKKFNVTYEQVLPEGPILSPDLMQLSLPLGVSVDVLVSSVVTPNHVFVQQPTHPSYPMLERLNSMMSVCYVQEEVPPLPRPIEVGVICAAPMFGTWYRAQVVTAYPETDQCDIKFVDYGGYSHVPGACLKQIRSDFTSLPFQAVECYMANIVPPEECPEFSVEASAVLESMVHNQLVQCEVVGHEDDGTPYVQIFNITPTQTIFVNRELVEQGVARWYEHTL